jgi:hypothetical protein
MAPRDVDAPRMKQNTDSLCLVERFICGVRDSFFSTEAATAVLKDGEKICLLCMLHSFMSTETSTFLAVPTFNISTTSSASGRKSESIF